MTLRVYARIVGLVLLCCSLVGFAEVVNTDLGEDFYHLSLGIFFLFAGFGLRETHKRELRVMVGGLGAFALLAKMPLLWLASSPHLSHRPVEFTCVVVGVVSILAALFLPGNQTNENGG